MLPTIDLLLLAGYNNRSTVIVTFLVMFSVRSVTRRKMEVISYKEDQKLLKKSFTNKANS